MDTLIDIYGRLQKKDTVNNCYYCSNSVEVPFKPGEARHFIEEYFKKDGKDALCNEIENLSIMRCEHMRSLFLLGIHVYDNVGKIKSAINNFTDKQEDKAKEQDLKNGGIEYRKEKCRNRFLYMWYLICLYHDVGYLYEKPKKRLSTAAIKSLDKQVNDLLLTIQHNIPGIPLPLVNNASHYYKKMIYCPYFYHNTHIDHGIIGGVKLYNTLEKLHLSATVKEDSYNNNLYWGKPIFDNIIIPVAWTIIVHNIWTPFKGSADAYKYIACGLPELVLPKRKPIITLTANPLLFLLSVLDTLEPVKMFVGSSLKESKIRQEVENLFFRIAISYKENSLFFNIDSSQFCMCNCKFINTDISKALAYYKKLENNLKYLSSDTFNVCCTKSALKLKFE